MRGIKLMRSIEVAKYQNQATELRLWQMRVKRILVVVGALGTVPVDLDR